MKNSRKKSYTNFQIKCEMSAEKSAVTSNSTSIMGGEDRAASPSHQKILDLNAFGMEELSTLQRQLDADIAFFNESLNELRTVSNKFAQCQSTLDAIRPDDSNHEALIPLSESVCPSSF